MQIPGEDKRKEIVFRIDSSISVVKAAAITTIEELAYGMSFLAHHRLYKMSKNGGVNLQNALAVADAFMIAAEAFAEEVTDELEGTAVHTRVSELGAGEVTNPYRFVGH